MIAINRLWGIRHMRWLWLSWRVHRFAQQCAELGLGMGYPNASDLNYLDAVWRGATITLLKTHELRHRRYCRNRQRRAAHPRADRHRRAAAAKSESIVGDRAENRPARIRCRRADSSRRAGAPGRPHRRRAAGAAEKYNAGPAEGRRARRIWQPVRAPWPAEDLDAGRQIMAVSAARLTAGCHAP